MILCMTFYVPGIHSLAIKFSCSTLTFDLNTSWGLAGCMSSGSTLERWERSSLPCWPRRSTLKFVEGRMQWTQRWAASTSSSQSLQRWVCCSPPLSASCVGSSPTWSRSEATVLLFTGSILILNRMANKAARERAALVRELLGSIESLQGNLWRSYGVG